MCEVSQLFIYPIKCLCGVPVNEINFTLGLGLRYDREWHACSFSFLLCMLKISLFIYLFTHLFCSVTIVLSFVEFAQQSRCMLDSHGRYINGKAYPACHKVTLHRFDAPATITVSYKDDTRHFGMSDWIGECSIIYSK
jgi:hypothetical protein